MMEFGSFNLEELSGEEARLNSGGSASFLDQFVPMPEVKAGQTGTVAIRILPPAKGGKLFQYNRTHKVNGRSVHCPRPLVNGKWDRNVPCPICEYNSKLWKQIEALEKQYGKNCDQAEPIKAEARDIKAVERYYYNAIVRSMVVDGKEMKNVGPRILSVGKNLHAMIIQAIVGSPNDPEVKLGNIADLKNGWDFIIRKTVTAGSEGYPKYDTSGFARNPSPAGTPEEIAKWATSLHDLTKLRNPREIDYIKRELAIHLGLIPDDTEGFDVDAFKAEWKQEPETQESARTQVTVPADIQSEIETTVAETTTEPAAETPAPPSEDLSLADDEFLKELQGMES